MADIFTHDLAKLAALAELNGDIAAAGGTNTVLAANWQTVVRWSERSRYEHKGSAEAVEIINAISDPIDGVLPWITRYW